ncbi:membrane protein [Spirochaetia bacterium]|nr:membrane protein [Spirochaetia bacterium]
MNILYTIIIYPLTQIIEFVFVFAQKIFKETGVSVLFISAAISILCLPLYAIAEKWQEFERNVQKKLKPKIDKIKAAFSGDEQYMILSTYYRQNHYHPVYALRSTFGLLIQIPFFIAAYSYLSHLEALKGAHFLLIADMGAPDNLVHVGSVAINILPVLMTLINIVAGAVYTKGFPLKEKIQLYGMALIFLVLLYHSPSGLVLYWTLNNIFSLIKNCYYKVSFRFKNQVIFALISLFCLMGIYYILAIHKGNASLRALIALAFAVAAMVPWLLPLIKKIPVNFSKFEARGKKTFAVFFLSALILWVLTGISVPAALIAASPQEFSYIDTYTTPLFFIYNTALQSLGLFVFWPLCLYFLFSNKMKPLFAVFALALCLGALCNVFAFPGHYGLISVDLQFASTPGHSSGETRLNIAVLCLIAGVVFLLLMRRSSRIIIPAEALCLFALLGLSVSNVFAIQKEYRQMETFHANKQPEITSIEPLFHLSKTGKNTVVIMLDRASSSFFPYILEESPDLLKRYSGFVYYPNTVSFNGYTSLGAPPVFGGYEYTPLELNKRNTTANVDKHNESLLMLPRLFSEAAYSVTITDPPYPNYSWKEDLRLYDKYPELKACITDSVYTDFWLAEHDISLPSTGDILKRNILWYSLFRAAPLPFRWGLYQWGDWCAPVSGQKLRLLLNGYAVLDYLPRLTGFTPAHENTALLMVNNTTHEGALLQAPEYRPVLNVTNYGPGPFSKETEYHINIAAFKRLADWFDFLKSADVYDNTRIILVSDHGSQVSYVTKGKTGLPQNFDNLHPILLVKDFDASFDIKTDMTFMSNADVPYLALDGQIENPVNPFTGREITMEAKKQPLYISAQGSIPTGEPLATEALLNPERDYYVHDNIFDEKNWEKAENK